MSELDSPLRSWLGRQVSVVIDRPLGSRHPRYPDLVYPVNYGYVPDAMAEDGEPVDVYVLGIDVPVRTFSGDVIAVVVRHDDTEDKLVTGPVGMRLSEVQIAEAIAFQEQWFETGLIVASDGLGEAL